jgi:hypothetical protein
MLRETEIAGGYWWSEEQLPAGLAPAILALAAMQGKRQRCCNETGSFQSKGSPACWHTAR